MHADAEQHDRGRGSIGSICRGVCAVACTAYFLQDPEKGLNGGVDFGYRSNQNCCQLRVFIGAAFSLIP